MHDDIDIVEMIGHWIDSSEICQSICDDASNGCEPSQEFITGLCLRMDSAKFFMDPIMGNVHRADTELKDIIAMIESVS